MTLPLKHIITEMHEIEPLPPALRLELFELPERIEFRKGEIILQPGELCDYVYYIEKGGLGSTQIHEGKRICNWLIQAGGLATSIDSFNNRVPSRDCIVALVDTIAHRLSWEHTEHLSYTYREFSKIRHRLTAKYQLIEENIGVQRRRTPEIFYAYLQDQYGELLPRISASLIASFMGISRASFYQIIRNNSSKS